MTTRREFLWEVGGGFAVLLVGRLASLAFVAVAQLVVHVRNVTTLCATSLPARPGYCARRKTGLSFQPPLPSWTSEALASKSSFSSRT